MKGSGSVLIVSMVMVWLTLVGCSGATNSADQPAVQNTASNVNASNANTAVNNGNSVTAGSEYPAAVREDFLESCETSGGSRDLCNCVFDKMKERYTFEEFSAIEAEIAAGQPPPEFVEFGGKARAACTK